MPSSTDGARDWSTLVTLAGASRLRHYLQECHGDRAAAAALYRWNAELSAAFWVDIGHLEVAVRNTIDRQLQHRHRRLDRTGHWIFDDAGELGKNQGRSTARHRQPYSDIDSARRRVRSNNKSMTPDQIISEISFGFWHQLVSQRHMFLWPDIATGFAHAPDRDQHRVRIPLSELRALRNRIGHHHRIWNINVDRRHRQLLAVLGYIDPNLATWVLETSQVPTVLARRPQMSH